jgi:hypothetical protein
VLIDVHQWQSFDPLQMLFEYDRHVGFGAPKAQGLTAKARMERRLACRDAWPSDTV